MSATTTIHETPNTTTTPVSPQKKPNSELLPPGGVRKERTAEQIAAAAPMGFDYPATKVGTVGNVTLYYDSSLGAPGLSLAEQMMNFIIQQYVDMETFFGINGSAVSVIVAPLSGKNDGSGGAYHYGCDFNSGGTIYVDATFANTTASPFMLELSLYIAELSECFMGAQGKGWGCGYSNGEALSRMCAELTPPGVIPSWGITAPTWVQNNYPNWVDTTEQTDRDYTSIGCGMVYLYWMHSKGYTIPQITQAGGATLADNYKALTGKTTAYNDLVAAAKAVNITTDNPFPGYPATWHVNDLTAAAKAPAAAGKPDGYMFTAQGTQHVNFRDGNGNIQELWWNGAWNINNLTAAAKAPAAVGDPCGYMFDAQVTQHVDYRDAKGNIQELYWDNAGWHNNNLTAAAKAPAAVGDPCGYMFDAQGTQHVDYRDAKGHIQELWWDSGGWHNNDLTAAAKAPLAASDPVGWVFGAQGTQHVVYRDVNGHIQELWWNGAWNINDLTAAAKAPLAAGKPTAYMFDEQGTQHVDYRDNNGHIQELWWNGNWNVNDLTTAAKAPLATDDPTGYMFDDQGTQHVDYRDANGNIQELWWNGNWNVNNLTADTKAPAAASSPAGYLFFGQNTQHAVYQANNDHINELWWG